MDNKVLSLYLSRILSGQYIFIYNNVTYKLIYPDTNIKYEAELYAEQAYNNSKYNEWINETDIEHWLVDAGLWQYGDSQRLENLEKQIEDHKVDLFNNFLNPSRIKSIRRSLSSARSLQNRLYQLKHAFDYVTLNGYCSNVKNEFLLTHSLYDTNNNLVFKNIDDNNYQQMSAVFDFINQNTIDIPIFRTIARNEIWRSSWSANKENIFSKQTVDWTDEQKTLVIMSKMYDSAYEHPECPPDSVIEDDDMFDGWMIIQRRESEKNKAKQRNEKMLKDKKLGNANEIFLVARSKEEKENIYSLNDNQARFTIREREAVLSQAGGPLKDKDLPDVQRNIVMQNNQAILSHAKRK